MTRLQSAMVQLNLARHYTLGLLSDIPDEKWFWMPQGGVTHVAWQVGHIAMAEYNLTLARIRGILPRDRELFTIDNFAELFGRTSIPQADAANYPTPSALRETLTRIHAQSQQELPALADEELDQPSALAKPHPIVTTKLSSLLWCAQHEMIHAGQVGLQRRMMGTEPKW